MKDVLLPDEFLEHSREGIVIDVRTPAEYEAGHIPGAHNIPLFTNEERAIIGTLYVQVGKDPAVERGLELVGPKLADFVRQARELSAGKPLFLYCWRGGMRSGSMAWLFRTAGFKTFLLKGGYKAYRRSFIDLLDKYPWKIVVLGGPTGCGKTEILHRLQEKGQQVIDLEGLAHHKGSAFGALGEPEQPTTEHFMNLLHDRIRRLNPEQPVWCEGESLSIGRIFIPAEFHAMMLSGAFVKLDLPNEERVQHILKDYGNFSAEELIGSFQKIEKRLGNKATNLAIEHIRNGELAEAVAIALRYYDKGYAASMQKHWPNITSSLAINSDTEASANKLIELYQSLK